MIRKDNKNWIKTGIEYVDGVQKVSAVVTREVSDWSVIPTTLSVGTPIHIKLQRQGDAVTIEYATLIPDSNNNVSFQMLRLAYFPLDKKVQIGIMAAAPGKERFSVTFEDFKVTQTAKK